MRDADVGVGVGALVYRHNNKGDSEFLLLKRARDATHGGGKWGLPGGWVDFGEDVVQTAGRELWEELNVLVRKNTGTIEDVVANSWFERGRMHVVCVIVSFRPHDVFTEWAANAEPDKCDDFGWFSEADVSAKHKSGQLFGSLATYWERTGRV